jgi:hypothetical protein
LQQHGLKLTARELKRLATHLGFYHEQKTSHQNCITAIQTWLYGVIDKHVKKKTCTACQQSKTCTISYISRAANSSYKKITSQGMTWGC